MKNKKLNGPTLSLQVAGHLDYDYSKLTLKMAMQAGHQASSANSA